MLLGRALQLTIVQLILGLTFEQRSISLKMVSTTSGTGSMTEHGIHLVELQEELSTQVSW